MRRLRNAKIVATLGPSSTDHAVIRALFDAGADVFRLNFSHGTHDDHKQRLDTIRAIERDSGRPIGVLLDLQGPKLRIGTFEGGRIPLASGARFRLDLAADQPGTTERVSLPHPEIFAALQPGAELLLDDGRVRLRVDRCGADFAETTVLDGSELSDRKGVNVPGVVLPLSALTQKDRRDLEFGLTLGVDWIALSFVQRAEDIAEIKDIVQGRAGIVAKLEKPAAIHSLEDIVAEADAVMVARGDLGVEMPAERVPSLQKRIVRACRRAGRPVIVATQMLESMVSAPVPTRAEASDVATAVYDGADAVMLSAESASGQYPVEAVSMMSSIICRTEGGFALSRGHPGIAHRAAPGHCRRHRLCRPPRRELAASAGHGGVYEFGVLRAAHGARAARSAHPRHDAQTGHRAAIGTGVGRARGALPRGGRRARDDGSGQPHRAARRLWRAGPADRDFGRLAVCHGRHDKPAAHRARAVSAVDT